MTAVIVKKKLRLGIPERGSSKKAQAGHGFSIQCLRSGGRGREWLCMKYYRQQKKTFFVVVTAEWDDTLAVHTAPHESVSKVRLYRIQDVYVVCCVFPVVPTIIACIFSSILIFYYVFAVWPLVQCSRYCYAAELWGTRATGRFRFV